MLKAFSAPFHCSQRSPSQMQLAKLAGGIWHQRPRQIRLRTSMLLLLCLMAYMWLTASRQLLVEHVHLHLSEAAAVRVSVRVHQRGLQEAGAAQEGQQQQRRQQQHNLDLPQFGRCRGPTATEEVPRLAAVRQWRSGRVRRAESVTLVTQLSLERLDMLENQCSVWPDVLAAVVYAPTLGGAVWSATDAELDGAPMGEALARLSAFHQRMEEDGACTLDLELAAQEFEAEEEAGLYPFNAARNRALMLAQTQALLLLDADFVPTPTMVAEYQTPEGYAELLRQLGRGQVIVLPAFETAANGTEGKALALAAVQRGKEFALREYAAGRLVGFQVRQYAQGHLPTNYELWAAQDMPYVVRYQKGYEPYVLALRQFVPWYDERFRGYGRDKIQHLTHLAGLNVTFSVHPSGFVVHVPHKKAATFRTTKNTGQWDKLYRLYVEVQRDVKAFQFLPVVSFPHLCNSTGGWRQEWQQQQQQLALGGGTAALDAGLGDAVDA